MAEAKGILYKVPVFYILRLLSATLVDIVIKQVYDENS